MGWEKGASFAQCFLMGQFGALSAITWITNDMRDKHDIQMKILKQDNDRQIAELNNKMEELSKRRWWYRQI